MNDEQRPNAVVVGLGNAFLSDDGVAGHILREVARRAPAGVAVVDAGLLGPRLLELLEGSEKAVIVDAVDAGGAPGTIWCFHPDDAVVADRHRSLHQANVLLYLRLADALGMGPRETVVVGVQPESLAPGEGLSAAVELAVAEAAERVLAEVSHRPRRPAEQAAAVGAAARAAAAGVSSDSSNGF